MARPGPRPGAIRAAQVKRITVRRRSLRESDSAGAFRLSIRQRRCGMETTRLALIGVPSSAGGRRTGQDAGPTALRAAGLVERLRETRLDVRDLGNTPTVRFRPDPEHPQQQNASLVLDVSRQVAKYVDEGMADGRVPLVLGGDCTISLGVIAGLLRHRARLGLLYLDADLDLNTPETTLSGILDGMALAHLLGRGIPELTAVGPRHPMLTDSDIVLFGYDLESGAIDPYEIEVLCESQMNSYPLSVVRTDPADTARAAVRVFGDDFDGFVVHFDIDVTNLTCVDVPHSGGLDADAAFEALKVLVGAPKCVALVVTEFNAELDSDGSKAERLVDGLVGALAPRGRGRGPGPISV